MARLARTSSPCGEHLGDSVAGLWYGCSGSAWRHAPVCPDLRGNDIRLPCLAPKRYNRSSQRRSNRPRRPCFRDSHDGCRGIRQIAVRYQRLPSSLALRTLVEHAWLVAHYFGCACVLRLPGDPRRPGLFCCDAPERTILAGVLVIRRVHFRLRHNPSHGSGYFLVAGVPTFRVAQTEHRRGFVGYRLRDRSFAAASHAASQAR